MVHLTDDLAALIGFAGEGTLWGAYAIMFTVSIVLLYKGRESTHLPIPVVAAHVALFVTCTTHYAIEFNHFYTTLAFNGVQGYANETTQLVGADILLSLSDLLGDFLLIYRLWVLWGNNYWIILLPSFCSIGGFACLMQVVHFVVTLDPSSPTPPKSMLPLTIAGYALPLLTNTMATLLITRRIWWLSRPISGIDTSAFVGRRLARSAIWTIVESGLLYFTAKLTFVVVLSIASPSQGLVAVMALQIYGIAPTLIIIRVMLGLSVESTTNVKLPHITPVWKTFSGYAIGDSRTEHGITLGATTVGGSSIRVCQGDGESLEMKAI